MRRAHPRVEARPNPEAWGYDELLTIPEGAELFWPDGLLTAASLRTAIRSGRLKVAEIGRKHFVTRRALEELSICRTKVSEER